MDIGRNMEKEFFSESPGISIYEDEKKVYVEVPVPGMKIEDIKIIFKQGILDVEAHKKEQIKDPSKKYFKKAEVDFSYRVALPVEVDEKREFEKILQNGVLKIIFHKLPEEKIKKISPKGH